MGYPLGRGTASLFPPLYFALTRKQAIDMVTFLRESVDGHPFHYSLLIRDRTDFLRLTYYCANIRMYMYTGVIMS